MRCFEILFCVVCYSKRLHVACLKGRCFCFYSGSEPPPEGETAIFLHGQEKIWKGFINMQSVAKFVTKAYLVSGSFEHLKEVHFLKKEYFRYH